MTGAGARGGGGAERSEKSHRRFFPVARLAVKSVKPQPPQTTCPALPQPPVQAPPILLHTAEATFDLAVPCGMPRAGHSHIRRGLCAVITECCLLLWKSPQIGKTATPTNHLPGPAAAPGAGSTTHSPNMTGCIWLPLQCPIICPGLAFYTLAGLFCELWLPSAASSSGNLYTPAKPQPPQTNGPALLQPPVQAPPHLLSTAEAAFDLAVPHGMPRAGHPHTGRGLCAVVAECCLLLWTPPQTGKTATPTNHPPGPRAVPSAGPTTPATHSRGCI